MEITIHSIHFDISEKLEKYIQKKTKHLAKISDDAAIADITLKIVKPETNANKDAAIKLIVPGHEFFVQQVADTFEEAIDRGVDSLERKVIKFKEKQAGI
jgi:ribosomal subunit interface protein